MRPQRQLARQIEAPAGRRRQRRGKLGLASAAATASRSRAAAGSRIDCRGTPSCSGNTVRRLSCRSTRSHSARLQRRAVQPPHKPHRTAGSHRGCCWRRRIRSCRWRCRRPPPAGPGTTAGAAHRTAGSRPDAAPPPAAPRSAAAPTSSRSDSAATLGASNRLRIATSTSSAARIRPISRVASSECPPSSKKLSSRPTRSTPQHLGKQPAQHRLLRRRAAPGALAGRTSSGAGSARRSSLPFGVSGSRSSTTKRRRHHVLRQRSAPAPHASACGIAPPPRLRRHHIADQPLAAAAASASRATTTACATARLPQQHRLDLARLDPEPAQLHLRVGPPQELQHAVRPPPRQVPGPVHPAARRRTAPCGSATNRSAVSPARFR